MVPHLTTSLTGPLHELERVVLDQRPEIERWFRTQWLQHAVPFYASVDLRNSGFKLAPVDTNLFPGGFNNLNPDFLPLCVHAAMGAVQKICPDASRFLLIPENHTRNLHYLSNVAMLRRILEGAGLTVRIGSLLPELDQPLEVEASNGDKLLLEPIQRKGNRVGLEGFDPCAVLNEIREKYAHYGITDEPFVIVKADAGTYGMGIMTVKSPDDVRNLNRKTRNKMATIKEGQPVHEVIIQEGVYTFESVQGAVAEPVIYMMDQFVVGGFYRVHTERGIDENLNSPGAKYVPLAFETNCHTPDCSGKPGDPPNRFYTYGVVARLANLAAAIEIEELVANARAPEVQAANA